MDLISLSLEVFLINTNQVFFQLQFIHAQYPSFILFERIIGDVPCTIRFIPSTVTSAEILLYAGEKATYPALPSTTVNVAEKLFELEAELAQVNEAFALSKLLTGSVAAPRLKLKLSVVVTEFPQEIVAGPTIVGVTLN